jgi:hypothetical protein
VEQLAQPVKPRAHLKLLGWGVATWLGFFVVGLPDYYQQYPTWLVAVGTVALVPPTVVFGWRVISRRKPEQRLGMALALSFYFTVPFALLDTLYCGVWLGRGHQYLVEYWYLTVFYVIPWVFYPPMAFWKPRVTSS